MSRKVFISMLGTGKYEKCRYGMGNFISGPTHFIQQATLEYIGAKGWPIGSEAIILLTDLARSGNWEQGTDRKGNKYEGLRNELEKMNLPVHVSDISIPDGKSEKELWDIFDKAFAVIQVNDEIYLDLTHSFRYIPMLMLVLINYAKFLKNITIKSITYGNWEARNEQDVAPFIDLLPLAELQDWTFAAGQYIRGGNVSEIKELSKKEYTSLFKDKSLDEKAKEPAKYLHYYIDSLEDVANDFLLCRGDNILEGKNLRRLNENMAAIGSTFVSPLNPIIHKIQDSISSFSTSPQNNKEALHNCIESAKWNLNHSNYQQAVTILQETVITYFCEKHDLNVKNDKDRQLVTAAFRAKTPNNEIPIEGLNFSDEGKQTINDITSDEEFGDLLNDFNVLSYVRNDINHFGMNDSPHEASNMKNTIESCLNKISEHFNKPC